MDVALAVEAVQMVVTAAIPMQLTQEHLLVHALAHTQKKLLLNLRLPKNLPMDFPHHLAIKNMVKVTVASNVTPAELKAVEKVLNQPALAMISLNQKAMTLENHALQNQLENLPLANQAQADLVNQVLQNQMAANLRVVPQVINH